MALSGVEALRLERQARTLIRLTVMYGLISGVWSFVRTMVSWLVVLFDQWPTRNSPESVQEILTALKWAGPALPSCVLASIFASKISVSDIVRRPCVV